MGGEIIRLGYKKPTVYKVRKAMLAESPKEGSVNQEKVPQRVEPLEREIRKLKERLRQIENRLSGSLAIGIRDKFKCNCGAEGYVAMRVTCTRCGRETWWGWWPKD
jgi:adenine-specific DNA methylase